eukprot:6394538-Amphidinium_carterae.1
MEMTTSLYEDPVKMGDDLSALGLRRTSAVASIMTGLFCFMRSSLMHVAYNVPTDLFMPLIQEYLSVVQSATEDGCSVETPQPMS